MLKVDVNGSASSGRCCAYSDIFQSCEALRLPVATSDSLLVSVEFQLGFGDFPGKCLTNA